MKIKMAFASYETLGFESSLYNLPILTLGVLLTYPPNFY
jgi:hypothetical protein